MEYPKQNLYCIGDIWHDNRYLPLRYDIVFENDRGVFSIEIYNDEGAQNLLYRIEKFDSETTVENVKNAVQILKNILKKNDFCLYITREDDKLYRKKGQHYKRVKDLTELMGDNDGRTKKLSGNSYKNRKSEF